MRDIPRRTPVTGIDRVFARLRPSTPRDRALWLLAAGLVFGGFVAICFRQLLGQDLAKTTVIGTTGTPSFRAWDQRYAIWAVSRNARAFLHPAEPFFDSGQCFPAKQSLALGHGVIALGLIGVLPHLFLRDPVLVYNFVFFALALSAPIAMYLLVTEWTSLPLAGIVSGLVYGLHNAKIGDPDHLYLTDTAWTVLSLLFLRRVFREPRRLGNAVGFALCAAGQLAAGVYPALASLFVGSIVVAGLVVENGASRRLIVPALLAALIVGLLGYAMYAPYLSLERHGALEARGRIFLPFASALPGGDFFVGFVPLGLALAGAGLWSVTGQRGERSRAMPVALLVAALVALFVSIGGVFSAPLGIPFRSASGKIVMIPHEPSRLYEWLTAFVPGLGIGRAPAFAYGGVHLCLAVLAGLGTASLLARATSKKSASTRAAALATPVIVAASVLLGLPTFSLVRSRPSEEDLRLFATLAKRGNRGPLLEYPAGDGLSWWDRASEAVLLTAYHGRPTSQCFASFAFSADVKRVLAVAAELPSPAAVDAVERLGFTTLVVPNAEASAGALSGDALLVAARKPGTRLHLVARSSTRTAFELR